jgi:large subunit ribosomal protein L24e
MVQKKICSFCGGDIEPGTGKMFVRKDGTVYLFCKLKCQKNMLNMGRAPRWVRWTTVYARAKHGAIGAEAKAEEAAVAPPTEVVEPAEGEVSLDFVIHAPKGKDIPHAINDLIDHRFGPELPASEIEKNFTEFTAADPLRHALGLWYKKRHPGKKFTEVAISEYVAFLDTTQAKKILKDWLDAKAKKEKGGK